MNEAIFYYLAGIFDGEGTFSIQVNIRARKGIKSVHLNPRMTMSLKDGGKEVMELLVNTFGGNYYDYKGREDGMMRWALNKRLEIIKATNLLLPHLIVKKKIAQRFLEALEMFPENRQAHRLGMRSWTKETVMKVANIAFTLNPYRKSKKTLDYLKELEKIYQT